MQSLHNTAQFPAPTKKKGNFGVFVGIGAVVAVIALGGAAWLTLSSMGDDFASYEMQPIEKGDIALTIVEKGELEASKNSDVICKVESSTRGSSISTTIQWLIEDGTVVSEDDVIMRLDEAAIKDDLYQQEIKLAGAEAALIQAEKDKEITESQNRSDIETAKNDVRIAELDLEMYRKGEALKKLKDVEGRITLAESDVVQWKDRAAWSAKMVKKGYISSSQAQADELKQRNAQITLSNAEEEKRVLEEYERERNIIDYQNKLAQAQVALEVAEIQAAGKAAQAEATYKSQLSMYEQELKILRDLERNLINCTVRAPSDGMVVYYVPESSRWRGNGQTSIIDIGEGVRGGQKMMRIPDLRHMQVKVKIHESLVPKLQADRMRKTGFSKRFLGASMVSLPGPNRLGLAVAMPQVREWFADHEEEVVGNGLPALIKVASMEKPMQGHIRSVSAVASSTDWMSGDVKVYPTIVVIDDQVDGLKPGMTAEVTILADKVQNVLRVPVHAVLGKGTDNFCYVKGPGGVVKRKLVLGLSNDRFFEVEDGSEIQEGDLVIQNPRGLADERGDLEHAQTDTGDSMELSDDQRRSIREGRNGPASPPKVKSMGKNRTEKGGPGGSQADRMRQFQEWINQYRNANAEKRKEMIDQIPEAMRERTKSMLKQQGIEVPE